MARVISLQLHQTHGAHPRAVLEARGRAGGGLDGDSHGDRPRRAVLVLDRSTLDALGLRAGDLREQITVAGLPDVTRLPAGTRLRVGGVTLSVNEACEPCTHIGDMNGAVDTEAFRVSLEGRRGALCVVVAAEGPIRVGDAVEVVAAVAPYAAAD